MELDNKDFFNQIKEEGLKKKSNRLGNIFNPRLDLAWPDFNKQYEILDEWAEAILLEKIE